MYFRKIVTFVTFLTFVALSLLVFVFQVSAQNDLSDQKEQELEKRGGYATKAIVYVPVAMEVDNTAGALSPSFQNAIVSAFKDWIGRFGGFEFIDIDEDVYESIGKSIRRCAADSIVLHSILSESIIEPVKTFLDESAEDRSNEILFEEQKNSMIVNKTHSSGATTKEIERINNTVYVMVPGIFNYKVNTKPAEGGSSERYTADIGLALSIFKYISPDGLPPKLEFVGTIRNNGSSIEFYNIPDALGSAVKDASEQCMEDLKIIPEFCIRNQSVSSGFFRLPLVFSSQQSKTLNRGDVFRFFRDIETNNTVVRKNAGWVILGKKKRVFDDESAEYNARVVSGIPRPGMTFVQVKKSSSDIILSYSRSNLKFVCKSDTLVSYDDNDRLFAKLAVSDIDINAPLLGGAIGVSIDPFYRRSNSITGFYMSLKLAVLIAGLKQQGKIYDMLRRQTYSLQRYSVFNIQYSLCKEFSVRRFSLGPEAGFAFGGMVIRLNKDNKIADSDFSGFSADISGGLRAKIALSPTLSLSCSYLYVLAASDDKILSWDPDDKTDGEYIEALHSGLSIKRRGFRLEAAIHIN